jgi:hypothetical protein
VDPCCPADWIGREKKYKMRKERKGKNKFLRVF